MPFGTASAATEVTLRDIDDSQSPAVAVFSDGSRLEFPDGCKFAQDNHEDGGVITGVRLRVQPPIKDGKASPSFLIPQHCSKQNVLNAIDRILKGV